MGLIPCSDSDAKSAALTSAVLALTAELKVAKLPPGNPLPQSIANAMASMASQMNQAVTSGEPISMAITICGIFDTNIDTVLSFGQQLSQITGRPDVVAPYLSPYKSWSSIGQGAIKTVESSVQDVTQQAKDVLQSTRDAVVSAEDTIRKTGDAVETAASTMNTVLILAAAVLGSWWLYKWYTSRR